ncbi:MAG: GAF domain-containing protein [Ardenticatenales bacterium]|nr:GAF domain-containing protein [Ardenticatenales bacterium]
MGKRYDELKRQNEALQREVAALRASEEQQRLLVGHAKEERLESVEAERSQRELAESLAHAAVALNHSLDLDAVLDRILEQTLRVVPCQAVNLMLVEGKEARIARHRGYESMPEILATLDNMRLSLTLPTLQQMRTSGQPVLIPDTMSDALWHRTPATEWVRSYAGVPLKSGEQIIGFLNVNSEHCDFFDTETTQRLEAFAAHATIAIQNARLYGSLEGALQQEQATRDQLIQASKLAAMGRLVASIAHEINNPLQAVQGCLTLAREEMEAEEPQPEMTDRYLSVAMSEIERITSIVQRIRDFYRPAPRVLQVSHPHHILDSVLELTNKQLQHHNITVLREWASELPLIECNPDHLKQVFLNLVLNAIDAMTGKEGALRVRTAPDTLPTGEGGTVPAVRIDFTDTGEGMSKETLSQLFEPFFTSKAHGTGLGLSISYRLIQSYHGEIRAASEPGKGATFTISLPIKQPAAENASDKVGSDESASSYLGYS